MAERIIDRITDEARLAELLEPLGGTTWQSPRGAVNYSARGEARRGTVLLVSGLSMHRVEWSPELIAGLHAAGYATLAADNRDGGRTTVEGSHAPAAGHTEHPSDYGLEDMAADLRELVIHHGAGPVHVVGISMGGMIAQHLALLAPELVLSLTSLMSTTGRRGVGRPHEQSKWIFTSSAPTDSLDDYLDYAVRHHESIAGSHYLDRDRARGNAALVWERGINPQGTTRQLAAIRADGDRTERLGTLTVPTLVVHGEDDPMIDISGGVATAEAVPGAELFTIPLMGHSVPWQCAGVLTERIVAHCAAASA